MEEFREFMKKHPKLNVVETKGDPEYYTDDIIEGIIFRLEDIIRGDGMCKLTRKDRERIVNEMFSYLGSTNITVDMDYEKKYKDALQRAKHALDCHNQGMVSTDVSLITSMFPELKESEDERIRKELIFYLGDMPEDTELRNGVTNRDVLAWLEKHKPEKDQPRIIISAEAKELDEKALKNMSMDEANNVLNKDEKAKWIELHDNIVFRLNGRGDIVEIPSEGWWY